MVNIGLFIFNLVGKYFYPNTKRSLRKLQIIIKSAIKNAINGNAVDVVYTEGKYHANLKKATIRIDDIHSLRFVLLELSKRKYFDFLSTIEIASILNHENAHANMAQAVGATHLGYLVIIIKEDERFNIAPFTHFTYPESWLDRKEKILDIIRILDAPDKYGDRTGVSDNKRIERMRKSLFTIHCF